MTDAELLARAAGGDRDAFGQLYDRHWKSVYGYAWLLSRSVPDAEDITQECFLALMRFKRAFDPDRAQLRTWLLAVARNQALSRRRGRMPLVEDVEAPDPDSGAEEELIGKERADALRSAYEELPVPQKEALYLFEFESMSLAETASILGIEPNAVKARLFRARRQLKLLLEHKRSELSWNTGETDDR